MHKVIKSREIVTSRKNGQRPGKMYKHYGWQICTDADLYHLFQYYERFRKKPKGNYPAEKK